MDSSNSMATQMALVKLHGSQNKTKSHGPVKGADGNEEVLIMTGKRYIGEEENNQNTL